MSEAINKHGVIVAPDEEVILHHPRLAWDRADIRLHRVKAGWVMGCAAHSGSGGFAWPCSPRHGLFPSRDAALFAAISVIRNRIERDRGGAAWREITSWLDGLRPAQLSLF